MMVAIVMLIVVVGALAGFIWLVYWAASRSLQRSAATAELTPIQTDDVTVVGKRNDATGAAGLTINQQYFLTFEFADGNRTEMVVPGEVFGLLVEGDRGTLTSMGGLFEGFERRSLR